MIELFAAELYDYSYDVPTLIGIYQTEELAQEAIDIVVARVSEKNPGIDPDARWVPFITPLQVNSFSPAMAEMFGYE